MPHVPTNILIFVTIELLNAKTEKSMHPIKLIYIYIYIYIKAKVEKSMKF